MNTDGRRRRRARIQGMGTRPRLTGRRSQEYQARLRCLGGSPPLPPSARLLLAPAVVTGVTGIATGASTVAGGQGRRLSACDSDLAKALAWACRQLARAAA